MGSDELKHDPTGGPIKPAGGMGGLLQFNGTATWNTFAPLAGVISSTPMNPTSAIKVADYMLSVGQLHRWTLTLPSECVSLTGRFEEIFILVVVVVAVGMWESASSISKVCGKGGKQHHRFPGFP
jgi:hypothetical protein